VPSTGPAKGQIASHITTNPRPALGIKNDVVFIYKKPHNGGVDAAARIKTPCAAPNKLRNTPPPLASNDLLCGSTSDESTVFDVLTKDDAHTIDIG
jgi:hypothetical protein